nr:DUF3365 domain-containing protein [Sulfurimonas sp. SAG-AH-194-L11]
MINKIRVVLILTFFLGSIVFYIVLDEFYVNQTYKNIKESIILSESIQKYVSEYQKPIIYKLIKDKKLSAEYFAPALMSSTFVIAHINEIFLKNALTNKLGIAKTKHKFASDNPLNKVNKTTKFESRILKKFNDSNLSSYSERMTYKGKDTLFFAVPSRKNTKNCLVCHGDPRDAPKDMLKIYGQESGFYEKVGDIRAINVVYSVVDANNDMISFYWILEAFMLSTFLIIYFIVNYFVKKLANKDRFILRQSKFAAMGEMIGMIAHQWRQPLTGMGMATDNLLLDIELEDVNEERLKKSLETINKQIAYLSHTIDDFKNFFKPNIKIESVEINKLIDESCMVIGSTLKINSIEIKRDYTPDLKVFTKKNDLMQVVLNLVKNSMDAYLENKIENRVVEIQTLNKQHVIEIIVKDYAGGIPIEIIEKIFNPYFSTKGEKNGTGLGLYMSKMIIENNLSGELNVNSSHDATTFTIILAKEKL